MRVVFWEKPGCVGNARQRATLVVMGHDVEQRNLLTHEWRRDELRSFFGSTPVAEWFNRSAPRVKSGEVKPESMDEEGALALLMSEPLLIRRPLLECEGRRVAGFDLSIIEAWAGKPIQNERVAALREENFEQCPGEKSGKRCGSD